MLCSLGLRDLDRNDLCLAQFVPAFPVWLRGVTTVGPGFSSFYLLRAQQGGLAAGGGAPNISCEA